MRLDNAEGSSISVELSPIQEAVLVGTLLGDGCLAKHGYHHRLHVKHKVAQRCLAEYKHEVFTSLVTMPLHSFDQKLNGMAYPCVQFATRTSPLLTKWHSRFYRDRRKIVPKDISAYLNELAVSVWFMDDGAADYAGVTFQTHNFIVEEVEMLASVLWEKFELATNLRRNKGKWIIYVPAASIPRLREIVSMHLLPELSYKLVPRRNRTP